MYQGGKGRVAPKIAALINRTLQPGQAYVEPFVGACWIMKHIKSDRRYGGDANLDLVLMWHAVQRGWLPPMGMSEAMYAELRGDEPSPLRGFAAFECSFAGKWFGGYARGQGANFAARGRRRLLSDRFKIAGVVFCVADYRAWNPVGAVIYCDPPYEGTTGFAAIGKFDSAAFWDQVRHWSRRNVVYVSEYRAPDDFRIVLEQPTRTGLKDKTGRTIRRLERVFVWAR